jgi:hypothetical protein
MTEQEKRLLSAHFGDAVEEYQQPAIGRLIVLPVVTLPRGCDPESSMGIFVANEYQGYPTRLFLERPVRLPSGIVPNTTQAYILGRNLYATSVRGVPASLPLHQAILAHVRRYTLDA